MDKFEELLKELSSSIGTPLVPDSKSTCLLVFQNEVKIQLELDKSGDFLIIGSSLGELPPGKYREQILIEALKNNRFSENGIFAFSLKKRELVLFEKMAYDTVDTTSLFALLQTMAEKGEVWQKALKDQTVPSSPSLSAGPHQSIFGLKR